MKRERPEMDLNALREEIDKVDVQLLALLQQRFDVIKDICNAKAQLRAQKSKSERSPPGNGARTIAAPCPTIHPARESEILYRLLSAGKGSTPPSTLIAIWRQLIGASSLAQTPLSAHITHKGAHCLPFLHFGPDIPIVVHETFTALFSHVSASADCIGFLPIGANWALSLIEAVEKGSALRIIGRAPIMPIAGLQEAFLLSLADCALSDSVPGGRVIMAFAASSLGISADISDDFLGNETHSLPILRLWHCGRDMVLVEGDAGCKDFRIFCEREGGLFLGSYHELYTPPHRDGKIEEE